MSVRLYPRHPSNVSPSKSTIHSSASAAVVSAAFLFVFEPQEAIMVAIAMQLSA